MPQLIERDAVAKKQDISDVIHIADKKKAVFWMAVKKGTKPTNTLTEWPVDNYPDVNTEGAVDEADEKDFEDLSTPDAMIQGRIQIWERKPKVSRLAEIVNNQAGVGPKKAFAKSLAKAMVVLVRDMEATFLSDNESRIGNSTKAYRIRGLLKWAQNGAQNDLPVADGYRTPTASIYSDTLANLTDDAIANMMQSIFDETGDSDAQLMAYVGSTLKRRISKLTSYGKDEVGFTQIRRYGQSDGKVISQKVDLVESDFGQMILRLSSFINTGGNPKSAESKRLGVVVNHDNVVARFAEAPNSEELPKRVGGRRGVVQAIGTLEVGNPLLLGAFKSAA
jgi:hypothetical protein